MFLNPLGLLALLGVPAVIALHLFRRRFERRKVSALFLWETRSTTSLSGRRRERLLRSPSFWSELLLALLLALAFAGPRACGTLEARHLVVVLDGSASMSAPSFGVDGPGPSPAQRAVETLRETIDELASGSRVTVIESGPLPNILIGPAAFPAEASARLDEYDPQASRHDLVPATALALEVADQGAVSLYTDHFSPETFPEQVGILALGSARENLGITRAARLILDDALDGSEQVLVTVSNFSARTKSTTLELATEQGVIASEGVTIPAGERHHFALPLPPETPVVTARIDGDSFPIDDEALLHPAPPRRLILGAELAEGEARYLGLERNVEAPLGQWLALVPRSAGTTNLEFAHLAIAHQVVGSEATWTLLFPPSEAERLDLFGPFLIEKRHPLLDGVSLDGVVWSAASDLRLPGTPLVSAGNLPILTEELTATGRRFHMNIDWTRSSLQRTPDWPILLDNLARLRRRELAGSRTTSLAVGEIFHYQETRPAEYELQGPGETRNLRAQGALAIEGIDAVGNYRLLQDGVEVAQFGVHFGDDAESDLRASSVGERASSVELAEQESGTSWVVMLLGIMALAALLLDWWFLRSKAGTPTWVPLAKGNAATGKGQA